MELHVLMNKCMHFVVHRT